MATVSDVIKIMEKWAPPAIAESWDNIGLITGSPDQSIESVIISLDVSEETLELSLKHRPSMIISHHPPVFQPLKTFTGNDRASRVLRRAIKEDIACFTAHTNLDQVPDGVSHALAEKLELTGIRPLTSGRGDLVKVVIYCPPEFTDRIREAAGNAGAGVIGDYSLCSFTSQGTGTYIPSPNANPYDGVPGKLSRVTEDRLEMISLAVNVQDIVEEAGKVHPYEEMAYDIIPLSQKEPSFGYGAVGDLNKPVELPIFIRQVTESLGIETVRISTGEHGQVHRIAVMGGSGRHHIHDAISAGADVFVSGDFGYHDFLDTHSELLLIDASHRATELPVLEKIQERIKSTPILKSLNVFIDHGTPPHSDSINEIIKKQ